MGILKNRQLLSIRNWLLFTAEKRDLITKAADEVIAGKLDDHFPLAVCVRPVFRHTNEHERQRSYFQSRNRNSRR